MTPLLWNTKQTAARLGISFWTVKQWAREGRIPVVRFGRSVRFSPTAIEKFIDANVVTAKAKKRQ